jgi:hypothetical protein
MVAGLLGGEGKRCSNPPPFPSNPEPPYPGKGGYKDNKNCFYFVEVIDRNAIICIMTFEQFKSLHNVIQPSN